MKKYFDVIQDKYGNGLSGAITVNLTGTSTKADLFAFDGASPISNPVSTDADGRFEFYIASGRYDLVTSSAGYDSITQTDVLIFDPVELPPEDIIAALGYHPEDIANKSEDTALGDSNVLYPSQAAVKAYADAGDAATLSSAQADAAAGLSDHIAAVDPHTQYVLKTTEINGHLLNDDVTLDKTDIGLANVTDTEQTQAAIVPNTAPGSGQLLIGTGSAYAPQTLSGDATLAAGGALTLASIVAGETHTKITYDAKGRVTAGSDATTSDVAEGSRLYYTDDRVRANRLDQLAAPNADVSLASHKLTNVTDPSGAQDAATKSYVDSKLAANPAKSDVQAATTSALPAASYDNGSSGVGATLTGSVAAVLVMDGYTPALNDRLLIKNQADAKQNGLFALTTVGTIILQWVLTRVTDFDQNADGISGALVFVLNGTTNSTTLWVCSSLAPVTFGSDNINFSQFAGTTYTADESSLHLSGTTFSLKALTGDVTTSAGGVAATIANDAVTYAKMQNVSATDKVLGRSSSGAGDVEEVTCTAAGRALIDDADAAAQRTTLGLGTLATQSGTFSGTSSGTNTGDETGARVATLLHAASTKSSLVDADEVNGTDSASSFSLIRTTWTSVKAFLKTYFDTLYSAIGAVHYVGTTSIANNRASAAQALTGVTSIDGSAATLTTPRAIDGQNFDGSAAITVIAPGTHAATSKVTPADNDEIPLVDSAASNVLKRLLWSNVKATLKTYFDALYPSGSGTSTGTNTGDQTSVSGNAGTATALQTSRTIDGQSFNGTANITVIAPGTAAATSKATPVNADAFPIVDSEASSVLKQLTFTNLKAFLKTYFDTLYSGSGSGTTPDVQTFNASGTWTKPSGFSPSAMARIQIWGAGGSGAKDASSSTAGGGGGGSYREIYKLLSALGSTETVTIGSGGAAKAGTGDGNPGGTTTFGSHGTAYGGGGGRDSGNGGGAGGYFAVGTSTNDVPGGEGDGGKTGGAAPKVGYWIGGGGGADTASARTGADSVWGGGGGGGRDSGTSGSGGTSIYGGNGGGASGTGTAGTQPGGGGGGSGAGNSGAGADGRVIVTVSG